MAAEPQTSETYNAYRRLRCLPGATLVLGRMTAYDSYPFMQFGVEYDDRQDCVMLMHRSVNLLFVQSEGFDPTHSNVTVRGFLRYVGDAWLLKFSLWPEPESDYVLVQDRYLLFAYAHNTRIHAASADAAIDMFKSMSRSYIKAHTASVAEAAVIGDDGQAFPVPRPFRHHDAIRVAVKAGQRKPIRQDQQGFMDSSGMFVPREHAYKLAVIAEQVPYTPGKTQLFSEDLW